ncbi:hypothetical protein CDL15_Pgr011205 [Punica granatum]|uniref:J domain-containing protein n=1 Tax=Punica granatum TaxID=22663 RepID=A0A218WF18_PUNGR|nr:hypothetical protein CDL15_Pgr011205 [Punica granatum]
MARKSNQQKNGVDHSLPRHKLRGAETPAGSRGKSTKAKVYPKDNLPDCDHTGDQFTGIMKENRCAVDANGIGKGTEKIMRTEKQEMDGIQVPECPGDCSREGISDASPTETWGRTEENETIANGFTGLKNSFDHLSYALKGHIDHLMENVQFSDNVVVQTVRRAAPYIMKSAGEWLEKQRPWLIDAKTSILGSCDYARQKIELAYPVVLKWLIQFGNIMLLLTMIWLDCTLRGIDSFLRMGTTSFFSFIWCAVFSAVAMVGMSKFLLVLAVAVLTGLFVGITFGLMILAICGTLALWFYGSFWTTSLAIVLGGVAFALKRERLALLIATVYSVYSAWTYVGFLGLLLGLNLSFISSDAMIYFLRNNVNQPRRPNKPSDQASGNQGQSGVFNDEQANASFSEAEPGISSDRSSGAPSTSGSNSDITSEDEVVRLLNCSDYYSVFGFSRYEDIDASSLKREYRKKAMLVHPDKNQGNEKAAEAFKKLQNAYEVLLDSLKRKAYDDELRREELLNYFRRFQNASQKNGSHGFFPSGFTHSEGEGEDFCGEPRRIACKRCNGFHIWLQTKKPKSQARWCQDCKEFHQAKDGDGWLEQASQPFLFGLLQKVNHPTAYVCAESKIYNATAWYICQGMRCPANTHKPSFHVNTSATFKHSAGKGTGSGQKGARVPPSMEETMTEEEFFEWLQNAVQAGVFDNVSGSSSADSPTGKGGNSSKSASSGAPSSGGGGAKKKKKGRKQW